MSDRESQMPGMLMHSGAKIKKDDKIGDYQVHLTPDMAGDWSVDLSYQGPQGPAKLTVPVNAKQQDVLGLGQWRISTFCYSG